MKKKKYLTLLTVFLICSGLFGGYYLLTRGTGDRQPPEITVSEAVLETSVYAKERELLQGITALDDTDGDVTESMVVESVSDIYDGDHVTIVYAAFDSAGNVSKAQRTARYRDYTHPHFTLSAPMLFREGMAIDVFSRIGARDAVDGDLSDRVKGTLVDGSSAIERSGVYQVRFRVTNSLGDTVRLTLPVEVQTSNAAERRLELTDYLVYLKKGSAFSPETYLTAESADRVSSILSDVQTNQAGVYQVTYLPENVDSYGKTRLMVVVEE